MLRFLMAGLATVGGLVLLFVASFGEPAALLRRFDTAFPVTQPVMTQSQPAPPALQQSTALEPPVQQLQGQAERAPQYVTSRDSSQAAQERDDLEALRQQRAVVEASLDRSRAEQQRAAAEALPPSTSSATATQPAALHSETAARQPPAGILENPRIVSPGGMTGAEARPAKPMQALGVNQPAPTHPLKTAQAEPQRLPALPAPPPAQTANRPDHPPPAKSLSAATERDAPQPGKPEAPRAEPVAGASINAVLDRLRREPTPLAPRESGTEIAGGDPAAYEQSQSAGARARLSGARAALAAGRIDEARRLLESAQFQLVFRPLTPSGEPAPGASRRAGEVAEALSMLGAGERNQALKYIDLAMGEPGGDAPALPRGYGYAGPPSINGARSPNYGR